MWIESVNSQNNQKLVRNQIYPIWPYDMNLGSYYVSYENKGFEAWIPSKFGQNQNNLISITSTLRNYQIIYKFYKWPQAELEMCNF